MKYNLKPLKKDNWFQFRKFKKCYTNLAPALGRNNRVVTGLTEDVKRLNSKGNYEVTKGTRRSLEIDLLLPENTLIASSSFWDTFSIKVGTAELTFDEDNPEDLLKLGVLRNIPEVAVGMTEMTTKAKADYLLYSKEEEAKINNKRKKVKREASRVFDTLAPTDMRDALASYGIKVNDLDVDSLEDKLGDLLEDNPAKFLAIAKDPNREAKKFIRRCLDKAIIYNEDGVIMYNETVLGLDINNAAAEVFSGKHKVLKETLENLLKSEAV